MDQVKVRAVSSWSYSTALFNILQLGSSPQCTYQKDSRSFKWTREAQQAFIALKKRLMSASVLLLCNPEAQFIVEVDASDVGVGGVLSQHGGPDQRQHLCAHYSHHLTPRERNYDVGDQGAAGHEKRTWRSGGTVWRGLSIG